MPVSCAVIDCRNRFNREKPVRFFRFPSVRDNRRQIEPARIERRALWVAALHRDNFPDSKVNYARICSEHFITGQPSDIPDHPDYIPSQKLGYLGYKTTNNGVQKMERFNRAQRRRRALAISGYQSGSSATVTNLNVAATRMTSVPSQEMFSPTLVSESHSTSSRILSKDVSLMNPTTDTPGNCKLQIQLESAQKRIEYLQQKIRRRKTSLISVCEVLNRLENLIANSEDLRMIINDNKLAL